MLRLKTRSQFQAVLREGSVVGRSAHFALHRLELRDATADAPAADAGAGDASVPGPKPPQALFAVRQAWMGAMVPKRWARRAVTRNLIKRQIYAVTQRHASRFGRAAHVLRLRSTFDREQFVSAASTALREAVREELESLLAKMPASTAWRADAATGS